MKKLYNIFMLLFGMLALTACVTEVDDVFPDSASERVQKAMKETRTILETPANGWRVEYYGDTSYGGYNVFMKFEGDSVTVASEKVGSSHSAGVDANGNALTEKSHYKIEQSQGVTFSLDEYNEIFHYLSDPNNSDYGEKGEGFEGDFEFRVISASPEKIVLKGKKHDTKILMYPMDENTTWGEYINKVSETEEYMSARSYTLEVEGSETVVPAQTSLRRLVFYTTDDSGNSVSVSAPYIVTADGYVFYDDVTVNGTELTGFNKGETRDYFVATNDSKVKLVTEIPSLYSTLTSGLWYLTYDDMGEYGKAKWNTMLEKLATNNNGKRERVYYAGIGYISEKYTGFIMATAVESQVIKGMTFKQVLDENKNQIEDEVEISVNNKANTGTKAGDRYYKNNGLSAAMEPFCGSKSRTFKITADNQRHPTYLILTDLNEPTNIIKIWANGKMYPFGDLDKDED